jgi:hypothetical protein
LQTAIDNDLYPHSGKPGFSPTGKPASQSHVEVDADDAAPENEDTIKSQKPN